MAAGLDRRWRVRAPRLAPLRRLPVTATPRGRATQVMVQFGIGGVLALTLVFVPGQDPGLVGVLLGAALVAACLVVAIGRVGEISGVVTHGVLVASSAITAAATFASPDPQISVALSSCYAFILLVAMASVSWLGALPHAVVGLGVVTYLQVARDIDATAGLVSGYILIMVGVYTGQILRSAANAELDGLTGLVNRRGAERSLEGSLAGSGAARVLSLAFLDLDHFKSINDAGGHTAGDAALRVLADELRRISRAVPAPAFVARWGGDEFVLAAEVEPHVLRAALAPVHQPSPAHRGVSVGIVQAAPGEGAGHLVKRADHALYAAKLAGRGTTHLDDDPTGRYAASLVDDLEQAVRSGALSVAYQPVVAPADGTVVGVEALARWTHPTRGAVPPPVFIAAAERAGLIDDLGTAVRDTACRDVAALSAALGRDLLLTVNASGQELSRPGYADRVRRSLAESSLPAGQLVVEVTESSMEAASPATRSTLAALRAGGVRVAIDDFGTGYSAFSRLDELPADYLKLDSDFTAATVTSDRRRIMLASLVDLCDALGVAVIAEGVETPEQADVLVAAGCTLAQGYLYARPVPIGGLRALLTAPADAPRPRSVTPVTTSDDLVDLTR